MQAQQQQDLKNILALKKKEFEINFDLSSSQYDPVDTIGTGAYGVVCSAVHRVSKQSVAIKKIPDIFSCDTIAKRTLREVRILKHFKHDNIISIREILKPTEGMDSFKDIYIVLDLMESDMHRVIHSKQDLSDEHIRYFLYQILRGLKYIHSANVIHRDLKPSNLLVNENCDLKIGDFGMARGISSNPDDYNHMLTQYVATRWYRAPEIMMATLAYSGAVDMWSVGCILAEMLGRRQLFPGHDYVDQVKLIIGIVGSPTKDFLNMITSENIRNFIHNLGHKQPESFRKLYPKAKNKALNLLVSILVLDPTKRVSTEDALKHPYFSTYHDPDDEPVCIPTFDFSFESKKLSPAEVKEGIIKEIMDYHTPKPKPHLNFNFRPVPKSELLKTPSPKVLKANATAPKFDRATCEQIAAQLRAKQSNAKPDEEPSSLKKVTPHPREGISTQHLQPSDTDIEMLSAKLSATKVEDSSMSTDASKGEEVKPAANAKEVLKMAILNARQKKGIETKKPVTALQRQKENEEKKKKKLAKAKEKKKKQKEKESPMKLSTDDLQMLERWKTMQSKSEQPTPQQHKQQPHMAQNTTTNQGIPVSQSVSQSQGFATTNEMSNGHGFSTNSNVHQNQAGNFPKTMLTGQIEQLSTSDSSGVAPCGPKPPPTYTEAILGNATGSNKVSFPPLNTHTASLQQQQDEAFANFGLEGKTPPFGSYSQVKHLSPSDLLFGTCGGDTMMAGGVGMGKHPLAGVGGGGVNSGVTVNSDVSSHFRQNPVFLQSSPSLVVNAQQQQQQQQQQQPQQHQQQQHQQHQVNSMGVPSMQTGQQAINFVNVTTGLNPPTPSMSVLTTSQPQANTSFTLPSSSSFPLQHNTMTGSSGQSGNPVLTQYTATTSNAIINPPMHLRSTATSTVSMLHQPTGPSRPPPLMATSEIPADFLSYLNRMSARSKGGDDLTLMHTPKGTGAGYGVGLDLDAILADTQPLGETRLDSAPLSASLIQDWMDMTGNLDTKDLESLDLEIGLPIGFNDLV